MIERRVLWTLDRAGRSRSHRRLHRRGQHRDRPPSAPIGSHFALAEPLSSDAKFPLAIAAVRSVRWVSHPPPPSPNSRDEFRP